MRVLKEQVLKFEWRKISSLDLAILGGALLLILLAWGATRFEVSLNRTRNLPVFESMATVSVFPQMMVEEKGKIEKITKTKISEAAKPLPVRQAGTSKAVSAVAAKTLAAQKALAGQALPKTGPMPPTSPALPPSKIIPPVLLQQVPPLYPLEAVEKGVEGAVSLKLLVLKDGGVGEAQLETSSGNPLLDSAAKQATLNWRFQPAKKGAESVEVWFRVPIRFQLKS